MKGMTRVMEHTAVYRLWQAPFAESKLAPVFRRTDKTAIRRVLDVGCGPGTNTSHFAHCDYLGIDINPRYIEYARERYKRHFVAADVTTYTVAAGEPFDFILVNSFFHHVSTPDARRILEHLRTLLTADGHIHVLDLVLPERLTVARLIAQSDRGEYPRPLEAWRTLFTEWFEPVVVEPYPLALGGVTLWNMVYFKGRARP